MRAESAREREIGFAVSMNADVHRESPGNLHLEGAGRDVGANGFVHLLEGHQLRYCILHGWRSAIERLRSDVDIAVDPGDLRRLERVLRSRNGGQLVQLLQHESSGYYFVLAMRRRTTAEFIAIDAAVDFRRDGYVFFTARQLLGDRRHVDGLWVAAPVTELAYLLVKKVSKGALPEHQKSRLQSLVGSLGEEACVIACRTFGAAWGKRAIEWLAQADWAALETSLPRLRCALRWQVIARDPLNPVRYWLPELQRRWRRWRHPTGLCVAVFGSDGAGKSTFIARLKTEVAAIFRQTAAFHLYPTLRERDGPPSAATDPHGKSPYPFWLSLLKVPYYVAIYGFGYLFGVRPRLTRSTLVLFDRYYDDLLVDPRRYRYGGPTQLARLARHLVPAPELRFILDVPVEQLLQRKREVSAEELKHQRKAYRRLATDLPGAVLLDGSLPPGEVARHGADVILDHLHQRYIDHRSLWLGRGGNEALDWLAAILCPSGEHGYFVMSSTRQPNQEFRRSTGRTFAWLSLKDGRGYLVPLESRRASIKALDLYNAQSRKAKLARGLLAGGLQLRVGKRLLPHVQLVVRQPYMAGSRTSASLLEYLEHILGHDGLSIAISLGTPGPHRKPVLLVLTGEGETLAYAKVGADGMTNALVEHESEVVNRLARSAFHSFSTPRILHSGWWNGRYVCVQSAPPISTEPAAAELNSQYLEVVRELAAFHTRWLTLSESDLGKTLPQRIKKISNSWYCHMLERGLRRAEGWVGDAHLPFHLSHGDFVPWNAKREGKRLFVFDWEYATETGVAARDVFHFLFQTMRFLQRRDPAAILEAFLTERPLRRRIGMCLSDLGLSDIPQELCLLLYCLERLSHSATVTSDNPAVQQELRAFANLLHAL